MIIQHPPIHAYSDYAAAYKAVTEEETDVEYFRTIPGDCKNTTLKKGQKKTITAGIDRMLQEDYAIWAALSSEVNLQKIMLMITDKETQRSLQNSVAQVAEFYDPGYHAIDYDQEYLKKRIDELNPSLIYLHIHFEDDHSTSKGYQDLLAFMGELMEDMEKHIGNAMEKSWEKLWEF